MKYNHLELFQFSIEAKEGNYPFNYGPPRRRLPSSGFQREVFIRIILYSLSLIVRASKPEPKIKKGVSIKYLHNEKQFITFGAMSS